MKNLNRILTFGFLFTMLSACNFSQTVLPNNVNPTPSPVTKPVEETETVTDDIETGNEITGCSPERIYQGETLTVTFRKSHGQNFAIYNEKTRYFYFLTENNRYYFPYIRYDEFKEMSSLDLEVSKVRSMSEEIDSEGYNKSKPYFTKTGWYRVIIGHQALDVDFIDMPVTGSCRVYYVNKQCPSMDVRAKQRLSYQTCVLN